MEIINLEKKKLNYQQKNSKNYTKMQKIAIFVKKNLKIKSLKIKNIINLVRDHCHYAGEYRGAAKSICNLKHRVPK